MSDTELSGTARKGLAGGCWWQEATKGKSATCGDQAPASDSSGFLAPGSYAVPCPERWGGDVITSPGSTAVPYAGATRAQETCYAHQPLWSAASWKGQINHALILMGQKVPAFPFYSIAGLPDPPWPQKHREMFSISEKQKWSLFTRKEYAQIINLLCLG